MKKWLVGAAELKVRNRLRYYGAAKRGEAHGVASDEDAPLAELAVDRGPTPSAALACEEEQANFEAALAQLDERQRQAVQMFHLEGLTHAEIALRLGITEGNSRTLLARSLARLTGILREQA